MDYMAIEHIVVTPGTCGGKPCVDGTRMRVQDIVAYYNSGMRVETLMEEFGLEAAQVHAALAYYYDHKSEIDHQMEQDKELADRYLAEGCGLTDVLTIPAVIRSASHPGLQW